MDDLAKIKDYAISKCWRKFCLGEPPRILSEGGRHDETDEGVFNVYLRNINEWSNKLWILHLARSTKENGEIEYGRPLKVLIRMLGEPPHITVLAIADHAQAHSRCEFRGIHANVPYA